MSHMLARLLCIAAVTALALPAYAQAPPADSKTTAPTAQPAGTSGGDTATAPTAMSQEEKTARAACESKPAADKEKCLKDVDAKYSKTGTMENKMGTPSGDRMNPNGDATAKPKDDTAKSGSYK